MFRMRWPRAIALATLLTALASPAMADTLRGRVTDPDGLPITGASVLVLRTFTLEATLTTNDTGRYGPKPLRAATYEVLAVARGYAAEPVTVTIGAGREDIELNITMTRNAANDYVVVTAPPLGIDALAAVTQSVTVFDRSEVISLQATSLADVLRLVPGLQVQSRGGAGAATSLSAWGGGPGDVLLIVDGVPQNLFGGGLDVAHINAADIDHIEVLRGPDSATQTARAASAVVRVTTLSTTPSRFDVTAEGGFEPSGHVTATLAQNGDQWKWNGAAEWLGTRGQNGRVTATGATVSNDDYLRLAASASVMWQDEPGRYVRWQGRAVNTSRGYPGPWGTHPLGLAPTVDTISHADGRTEFTGLSALLPTSGRLTHRLDVSFAHWRNDLITARYPQDISTRSVRFHYHIDAEMTRTTIISAGAEREWERAIDSLVRNTANDPLPLSRAFTSWFGEVQQSLGTRIFLSGGGRWDVVQREALEGNASAEAYRPALAKKVQQQLNGRGSATAVFFRDRRSHSASLRLVGGTASKPPTAEDIGFSENPGLRPERSRMASAGLDIVAGTRLTLTTDVFRYHFDDLIVPVVLQQHGVRRIVTDNVAAARARGVTAGASLRLVPHVVARGSVTWLDTRVLDAHCDCPSPLPIGDGTALVRRPKIAGSASLVWSDRGHSAFVTAGGRGPMRDVEPLGGAQLFDNAGYLSVAAGLSLTIARPGVQVFVRGSNLLNRVYEEQLGYPAPLRAVVVGLRLTAGQ